MRNLFESRTRLLVSVGSISMAMLLILALDAIFAGSMQQVTKYIDETEFDVVVAQDGVKNLHMTSSFFPEAALDSVSRVSGVTRVDHILYSTVFLASGDKSSLAYLIGYEPGELGGPWVIDRVPAELQHGEIVIDEVVADQLNLGIGDSMSAGGVDYRVGGLTRETVNVVNSIAFVRYDDFEQALGVLGTTSYGLVTLDSDADPSRVVSDIERIADVTSQTKADFAASERSIIADMSVDMMRLMNAVAFFIGLIVVGLSVHTATLAKMPEYGVLKAVGGKSSKLLTVVVTQAYMATGMALFVAVLATLALALALRALGSDIQMLVTPISVGRVGLASAAVAAVASWAPIMRVAGLNPAQVFRS